MNPFFLATKVWQKAKKENNRLILDKCSEDDVQILVRDSNAKSVKAATESVQNSVIRLMEFERNLRKQSFFLDNAKKVSDIEIATLTKKNQ